MSDWNWNAANIRFDIFAEIARWISPSTMPVFPSKVSNTAMIKITSRSKDVLQRVMNCIDEPEDADEPGESAEHYEFEGLQIPLRTNLQLGSLVLASLVCRAWRKPTHALQETRATET